MTRLQNGGESAMLGGSERDASGENQQLVERAQQGDVRAFDEIYHRFVDRVHWRIFSIIGPDPEVDDVVQATFLNVFRELGNYRGPGKFKSWVYRVAVNAALNHVRQRDRRRQRDATYLFGQQVSVRGDCPYEDTVFRQNAARLQRVLLELSTEQHMAFVLYEVQGHSLREMAEILHASINTVAARLRAARVAVRRAYAVVDEPRPDSDLNRCRNRYVCGAKQ